LGIDRDTGQVVQQFVALREPDHRTHQLDHPGDRPFVQQRVTVVVPAPLARCGRQRPGVEGSEGHEEAQCRTALQPPSSAGCGTARGTLVVVPKIRCCLLLDGCNGTEEASQSNTFWIALVQAGEVSAKVVGGRTS